MSASLKAHKMLRKCKFLTSTGIQPCLYGKVGSFRSRPEACGLRHLAFAVADVELKKAELEQKGVFVEPIRVDEYTDKKFTFFADPDGLPLEIYEVVPVT